VCSLEFRLKAAELEFETFRLKAVLQTSLSIELRFFKIKSATIERLDISIVAENIVHKYRTINILLLTEQSDVRRLIV